MSTVIVGGGISGLYAAYKLVNKNVQNIHLYEASDRIGGRIYENRFHDFNVPLGASMIRLTDNNIIRLCQELNLDLKKVEATLMSKESDFINDMIEKIINKFDPSVISANTTVMEFLQRNFTSEEVQKYIDNSIYRDYLQSNIHEYLFHYPITDHLQEPLSGFVVKGGYSRLIDALYNAIKDKVQIHLNTPILRVSAHHVFDGNMNRKRYRQLYWTITEQNKHLIGQVINNPTMMNNIYGVPFLKMYAHVENANQYPSVVVGGLLGKLFPMGKNILMVAYTDGDYATKLYDNILGKSKQEVINYIQQQVRQLDGFENVVIGDVVAHYWSVGIHQYRKLVEHTRQKYNNIYLLGEAISFNQGWAEGAVEMVDNVI